MTIKFYEFRDAFTHKERQEEAVEELNKYINTHPKSVIRNVEYRVVYVKEFEHAQTNILLEVEE